MTERAGDGRPSTREPSPCPRPLVRPFVLSLCLLALVAFGGCSALPGAPTATPAAPTPAPVPTDEPTTAAPVRLAPGVSATGVTDPARLLAAHRTVLTGTPYRTVRYDRTTFENGTVRSNVTTVAQFDPREERFHVRRTVTGRSPERAGTAPLVALYGAEELVLQRRVGGGEVRYSRLAAVTDTNPPRTAVLPAPMVGRSLFLSVRAFETRVTEELSSPVTTLRLYRLVDVGVRSPSRLRELTGERAPVRNASLDLVVGTDGVVYAYRVRYTTTVDGAPVTVVTGGTVSGLGATRVAEPRWVDAARAATE